MPTYSGQIATSHEAFDVPNVTTDFDGTHTKDSIRKGVLADGLVAGAYTEVTPAGPGITLAGSRNMYSFFDDFYNRFYFVPAIIDFQAIAGTTLRSVVVWNAYLDPLSLNTVAGVNDDGLTLGLPGALPLSFLALQNRTVTVTAEVDGPPEVAAQYTFTFSNGVVINVPVTGTRAKMWAWGMNWKDSFEVEIEYKTEIITSRNKREQRIAQRQTPRKALTFSFSSKNNKFNELNLAMTQWASRTFIVPDFALFVTATSALTAFDVSLDVDEVPVWAVPGATAVLQHGETREARTVASVGVGTITFSNSTATVFPEGTKVHYGYAARLASNLASRRLTNAVQNAKARFEVIPASEPAVPVSGASVSLAGHEIWLKRFNWADDITVEYQFYRNELDFGRGRSQAFFPVAFNPRLIKGVFMGRNNTEAQALIDFFHRCKGQRGEFYRPTFEYDLPQRTDAPQGTVYLRTPGYDVFDAYTNDPFNKAVCVVFDDGTYEFKRIVGMEKFSDILGDDTRLEIETPWTRDIDSDQITMICWMPLCRLATDSITVDWKTDSVCNITFPFTYVHALDAESLP